MRAVSTFFAAHKVVGVVVGGAVVAGVGTMAIAAPGREPAAEVVRVVHGDMIDVRVGGEIRRIVLADIDAPESVADGAGPDEGGAGPDEGSAPEESAPCLGAEARDFVARIAPVGSSVRLRYDGPRQDDQGREVAAVYAGETLINVEVVRAGLGVALPDAAESRFSEEVRAAADEARRRSAGLHDTDVSCTIPARLAALEAEVSAALEAARKANGDLAELEQARSRLAEAEEASQALAAVLSGDAAALPLAAYPTSVGAMRILADRSGSMVARELVDVDDTMTEVRARLEQLPAEPSAAAQNRPSAGGSDRPQAVGANAPSPARPAEGPDNPGRGGGASGSAEPARGSDSGGSAPAGNGSSRAPDRGGSRTPGDPPSSGSTSSDPVRPTGTPAGGARGDSSASGSARSPAAVGARTEGIQRAESARKAESARPAAGAGAATGRARGGPEGTSASPGASAGDRD